MLSGWRERGFEVLERFVEVGQRCGEGFQIRRGGGEILRELRQRFNQGDVLGVALRQGGEIIGDELAGALGGVHVFLGGDGAVDHHAHVHWFGIVEGAHAVGDGGFDVGECGRFGGGDQILNFFCRAGPAAVLVFPGGFVELAEQGPLIGAQGDFYGIDQAVGFVGGVGAGVEHRGLGGLGGEMERAAAGFAADRLGGKFVEVLGRGVECLGDAGGIAGIGGEFFLDGGVGHFGGEFFKPLGFGEAERFPFWLGEVEFFLAGQEEERGAAAA